MKLNEGDRLNTISFVMIIWQTSAYRSHFCNTILSTRGMLCGCSVVNRNVEIFGVYHRLSVISHPSEPGTILSILYPLDFSTGLMDK
jgi:hypothetical protein